MILAVIAPVGSSPRVRGTPARRVGRQGHARFIPASAGNAVAGALVESIKYGSSPRVRGTHREVKEYWTRRRFIPASAGNAKADGAPVLAEAVHPRECGERRA